MVEGRKEGGVMWFNNTVHKTHLTHLEHLWDTPSCVCVGSLPQCKDVHVRLIGDSKLHIGVSESARVVVRLS